MFALVGLLDAVGANYSYLDSYMGFGWSIKATIHCRYGENNTLDCGCGVCIPWGHHKLRPGTKSP
jgi:hypothetical protein